MEAGSHSGIARLVQQSLGTSALFPSYVFVTTTTTTTTTTTIYFYTTGYNNILSEYTV
jgi:hypothetical protein